MEDMDMEKESDNGTVCVCHKNVFFCVIWQCCERSAYNSTYFLQLSIPKSVSQYLISSRIWL